MYKHSDRVKEKDPPAWLKLVIESSVAGPQGRSPYILRIQWAATIPPKNRDDQNTNKKAIQEIDELSIFSLDLILLKQIEYILLTRLTLLHEVGILYRDPSYSSPTILEKKIDIIISKDGIKNPEISCREAAVCLSYR